MRVPVWCAAMRIALRAVSLVLCFFVVDQAYSQDREGSKDHPLISRYPGSAIDGYSQKEFDEYELPLSKAADGKYAKTQHVEGKVTAIHYNAPSGRSALEIYRNYEAALQKAGFQTLFSCGPRLCGEPPPAGAYPLDDAFGNYSDQTRYLAAKLSRPQGDVYVALWVYDSSFDIKQFLAIVESKPMESGLVSVSAEALGGDIRRNGHAAVYGIYFDTGKAEVKPESDAALKEIAHLLQEDPQLKLYVVGHTDNQGVLDMNLELSKRRADAVLTALTAKFGVAAARLHALGDGPSAPVASNDTEEGRSRNRRVELVKQ